MSPRLSAHHNKINLNGDLFRRIEQVMHAATPAGSDDEQARVLERYHTDFPPGRRPSRRLPPRRALPRSASGSRRSAPPSARTCWPTSATTCWCWRRGRSRRPAGFPARRGRQGRRVARPAGQACRSRSAAPASSPSCNIPHGAICAKRRSAPGSRAATMAGRPTTRRSSPRWWRCGPSARSFSAIRAMPIIGSTIRWPRRPRAVRELLGEVWPRALKRALADRDALQALVAGRGRQFQDRALGLALLRREAAQAPARCR